MDLKKKRIFVEGTKERRQISVNYNIYDPKPIAYTNSGLLFYKSLQHLQPHPPTHEPNPLCPESTNHTIRRQNNKQSICLSVCSWNTSVVVSKNQTLRVKKNC